MGTFASVSAALAVMAICGIAAWGWVAWRRVQHTLHSFTSFEHMHLDR